MADQKTSTADPDDTVVEAPSKTSKVTTQDVTGQDLVDMAAAEVAEATGPRFKEAPEEAPQEAFQPISEKDTGSPMIAYVCIGICLLTIAILFGTIFSGN